MSDYLFVLRIVECPTCHGSGQVCHPMWAEFNATVGKDKPWCVSPSHMDWWTHRGFDKLPPYDIADVLCGGSGKIELRIPLRQALLEIKQTEE